MTKDNIETIRDYIKAYKAYLKTDEEDDREYALMQSCAIRVITDLKLSYKTTYRLLYEYCKKLRKGDKDDSTED